ncbi:response regulator, partial [Acinetobacter baumannii]
IRLDLADILREGGYRVHEAADGEEALALLQAVAGIGLVITDVRMPGELDGLALARRIRAAWPGLPVAIASAHWQDDAEHLADRLVPKP